MVPSSPAVNCSSTLPSASRLYLPAKEASVTAGTPGLPVPPPGESGVFAPESEPLEFPALD